jgi:hypothetical protein
VTHGARDRPREEQQERQAHQLHPPGDHDPRRRGASRHHRDGIAGVPWSFFEDGGLALDPRELWLEPAPVAQQPARARLKEAQPFDTVPAAMPSSRPPRRRRVERREMREARRARRFALLTVLAVVLVVALVLSAFGGSSRPAPALAVANVAATTQTKPFPQIVALHGAVRLQMPIVQTQATAIGYHSSSDNALDLSPIGHQGNEGIVQRVFHKIFGGGGGQPLWYQLDGGSTSALDVGAPRGASVFSPVDGSIVGLTPYIVAGRRFGSRIDIQPQNAPSLLVSVTQLTADPSLYVGKNVVSGATRIGSVVDLAQVERQALARYTNDSGNHVSIELRAAAALVLN